MLPFSRKPPSVTVDGCAAALPHVDQRPHRGPDSMLRFDGDSLLLEHASVLVSMPSCVHSVLMRCYDSLISFGSESSRLFAVHTTVQESMRTLRAKAYSYGDCQG